VVSSFCLSLSSSSLDENEMRYLRKNMTIMIIAATTISTMAIRTGMDGQGARQESFGAGSLWIHKPESPVDTSQNAGPAALAAEDRVTVGVLPPHEESRPRPRIKKR
jgi:hypothetical protein